MNRDIRRAISVAGGILIAIAIILVIWTTKSNNDKHEQVDETMKQYCFQNGWDSSVACRDLQKKLQGHGS